LNDARKTQLEKLPGYLETDPDHISLLFEAGDLALEAGDHEHARPLCLMSL
jgi:hypothetical protein